MKKHAMIWVVKNIVLFVILFITIAVLEKLVFGLENWLYRSLVCSVAYVVGVMLKQGVVGGDGNTKDNVITRIGIILLGFILAAFITGIVLNIERWFVHVAPIVFHLAIAIFLGTGISMEKIEEPCGKVEEQESVDGL